MTFKLIENFITNDEIDEINKIIDESQWNYVNSSTPSTLSEEMRVPPITFWGIVIKNKIFEEKILKRIEKRMGKKFEVLEVKVNGQTYGLDGSWHRDHVDDDDDKYTLLIYVSEIYPYNIQTVGGYTYFRIDNNVIGIEPYRNRAVFFDARIEHKGMAPKTKNILRTSVAFRLKEIQ